VRQANRVLPALETSLACSSREVSKSRYSREQKVIVVIHELHVLEPNKLVFSCLFLLPVFLLFHLLGLFHE
jgi:hypothetical protein